MKKVSIILLVAFVFSFLFSCGSTTRRTNCKGNGSWYGKRNLSSLDKIQKQNPSTYIAFENKEAITKANN